MKDLFFFFLSFDVNFLKDKISNEPLFCNFFLAKTVALKIFSNDLK